MPADPPYTFGLGPKSEHTLEAGDGHGGKFTVKNSSDSVVVVSVHSPDATTLEVEIIEATHVSRMSSLADLPRIKLEDRVLQGVRKKNHDPTQNDMLCLLLEEQITEHDSFHCGPEKMKQAQCAIYWYAMLNHNGQGSNLYTAMRQSQYKPKLTSKLESEGPEVAAMYRKLCEEYD